jgi:4-amino-4-deoxy-L-arabinose transferase-like glycosyltransferase
MALGAVVVAAAVLRLATLDLQSFWLDEASTVQALDGSFGHLWHRLTQIEAAPPLYFVVAWAWGKVFGLGEVGLRSLSALFGIATVPVAWALGRRLAPAGRREAVGLLAAALAATSPFLIWFSQEARPYALLTLLTATATLCFVLALQSEPERRPLVLWGLAAAGAVMTHYFAVFFLVPQAAVLGLRLGRRAIPGLAIPAATGLALVPLVLAQGDTRVTWVSGSSLSSRAADVAKHWVAGPFGTSAHLVGLLALTLLAIGVVLSATRRSGVLVTVIATTAAALALPVLTALAGPDYVLDRYLIPGLVPLLVLAAVGLAQRPPLLAAGAGLALLFGAFAIETDGDRQRQREDWRGASRDLAAGAVVVSRDGDPPLHVYRPRIRPLIAPTPVRNVTLVASWRFGRPRPVAPPPPGPGFALAGRRDDPTMTILRYTAAAPQAVDPGALAALALTPGETPVVLRLP